MKLLLISLILLSSCRKATQFTSPPSISTLQANQVSPLGIINPFLCSIDPATQKLTCVATTDVNFRRGLQTLKVQRGYQFSYDKITGLGKAYLWFGCAATNTCDGFFIFASDVLNAVPVEPARYWNTKGTNYVGVIPLGSLPILEVTSDNQGFYQILDIWSGPLTGPVIQSGSGIVVTCVKDVCTITSK